MAQKLSDQGLLKLFSTGQGAGAGTYTDYAGDLDFDFGLIEGTVDTLVDEVRALAGPNSLIQIDLVTSTSPAVTIGTLDSNSFDATFSQTTVPDDTLDIAVGSALTGQGRLELTAPKSLVGSGASGTRWAALQADGDVTLETAASQGVMDLWSVTWDGSAFTTATLARLQLVMPAGDDFQNSLITADVTNPGAGLPDNKTYLRIANKLEDIDRILKSNFIGIEADTLGRISIGGTSALPGLILSDGTLVEATTGLYRDAADSLGVTVLATQLLEWTEVVADEPQQFQRAGTTLARPPYSWIADGDTGLGWLAADEFRAIAGALECLRFFNDAGSAGVGIIDGDAANPGLVLEGDRDTGFFGTGTANEFAVGTGGVQAMRWDANRNVRADLQYRLHVTTTAEDLTTGASYQSISMDTEVTDVGAWGAAPTATWTVPALGDGFYWITGTLTFDEATGANAGTLRDLAIEINGSVALSGKDERAPRGAGTVDNTLSVSHGVELAAAQTVRLQARQDSGSTETVDATLSIVRLW